MVAINPSALTGYLAGIETLNGSNLSDWKQKIESTLSILDLDLSLHEDEPPEHNHENAIPDEDNAKSFMSKIQEQLLIMRYDGHTFSRDHVMQMIDITNQLKSMDIDISEAFLNLNEVQIMCIQEEERLNQNKLEVAHLAETNSGRKGTFRASENKGCRTHADYQSNGTILHIKKKKMTGTVRKCFFCKKNGYSKRDCFKYKKWLENKGIHQQSETH
ncbi:hypothetical protein AMTRI_Chr01g110270 [Amborella trichopoda]